MGWLEFSARTGRELLRSRNALVPIPTWVVLLLLGLTIITTIGHGIVAFFDKFVVRLTTALGVTAMFLVVVAHCIVARFLILVV